MKRRTGISGDRIFALIVAILVIGGAAMFLSASLGLLARSGESPLHIAFTQLLLGLLPGVIALFIIRYIPFALIQRFILPFFIFALLLTLAVFIPGVSHSANGATRWISIGSLTVQPAEFLKVATILMFSAYLAKIKSSIQDPRYGILGFAVIIGIPAILLLLQPNTSTVLIIGTASAALYFIAGAPWRDFAILGAVALIGLTVLVFMRPYLMQRVQTFIHPADDSLTSGYQVQQSLIAIGSGGLLGRGFGQSAQKFNYLPEPVGDSIFAVFGEEFGFIGTVFIILLFMAFAARGFFIASEASTPFGALAVTGLTLIITLSAFLNIGAMLGVLPLTGLPLPFVSHGGTALLVALASVGIILNIAAHKGKKAAG
jgi:cell division protein FtsW